MLPTRAVFLLEPTSNPNHLTDYRVLLISSTLYRLWAKCRSRQLDKWARTWADEFNLSAAPGRGAHDGHYDLAIHIEHAVVKGLIYGGSCTDLEQCFDRILREVIIPIAIRAGFPTGILVTYLAYIENITIYHDYALGLGKPRKRPASIPQGCPLSMRSLALIIAPWTKLMQVHGAISRALADDLTTISTGENAVPSTTAALYATYEYLNAFGRKVRVQKTWAYASETDMRTKLATVKFPGQINVPLEVVHEHRDLGATLTSPGDEPVQLSQTGLKRRPDNVTNLQTYPALSRTDTASLYHK